MNALWAGAAVISGNAAAGEVLLSYTPPSEFQRQYVKSGPSGAPLSQVATIQSAQAYQGAQSQAAAPANGGVNFYVNAEISGGYDNWSNTFNLDDKGEQFSENLTISAFAENVFVPKGTLSFLLLGGHVHADVDRGSTSKRSSGFKDTTLNVGHSRPVFDTWSAEAELQFNLPTGRTKLTELERLTLPTTGVVSDSFVGSGFDAGFDLKFRKPIKSDSYYVGAGYARRGSYDPTSEISGDTVDAGHEIRALAGWSDLALGDVILNIDGRYARGQGYGNTDSNSFGISVLGKIKITEHLKLDGSYSFLYNDSQPTNAPSIVRNEQYRQGYLNSFGVGAEYNFSNEWTLKGFTTGAYNATKQPADTTYFGNNWSFAVGVEPIWNFTNVYALRAMGKYSIEGAESSASTETRFSGYSFVIGLAGKF